MAKEASWDLSTRPLVRLPSQGSGSGSRGLAQDDRGGGDRLRTDKSVLFHAPWACFGNTRSLRPTCALVGRALALRLVGMTRLWLVWRMLAQSQSALSEHFAAKVYLLDE